MIVSNAPVQISHFESAIILARYIDDRCFCQSIFLHTNVEFREIRPYLDCSNGIDFFSLRAIDQSYYDRLDAAINSFGNGIFRIHFKSLHSIDVRVSAFHGSEADIMEISEIRISSEDGKSVLMVPDPDRIIADQMQIIEGHKPTELSLDDRKPRT